MVQQRVGGLVKDDSGNVRSGWVIASFAVVTAVAYFILSMAAAVLGLAPSPPLALDDWRLLSVTLTLLIATTGGSLVCWFAFQAPPGFGTRTLRPLLLGVLWGAVAVSLCCLAGALGEGGSVHLGARGLGKTLLSGLRQLVIVAPTSIGEELLLRGVVLQQLRRGFNTPVAVLLTGGVFGLLHIGNPNANLAATVNIVVVGLWFGAMVWCTGSLWASIGLHVTWNWFEGFVFGTPVSGLLPATSLFAVFPGGGPFFNGGLFGPEAAWVTTVVLFVATAVTVLWPKTRESAKPSNG
jgi:membrane protease YdiL (CAAX protease family)